MDKPPDYAGVLARDRMEWEILQLLLLSCEEKSWWPIEEIVRATPDPIITRAALRFFRLITWP
jgi:hypothetical protein